MRRINIFVLLCAFVLAMSSSAWAAAPSAKGVSIDVVVGSKDIILEKLLNKASTDFVPDANFKHSGDIDATITTTSKDAIANIIKNKVSAASIDIGNLTTLGIFQHESKDKGYIIASIDLAGNFANVSASNFIVGFVSLDETPNTAGFVQAQVVVSSDEVISLATSQSVDVLITDELKQLYAVAEINAYANFVMVAAVSKDAAVEEQNPGSKDDEEDKVIPGSSTTEKVDELEEDIQTSIFEAMGGELTAEDFVTGTTGTIESIKESEAELYKTLTSSDALIEAIAAGEGDVTFKAGTVTTFGLVTPSGNGRVLQKATAPAEAQGLSLAKIVFYFIKVSFFNKDSASGSAATNPAAFLAAEGDMVEATLFDTEGKKLTEDTLPEEFYAVPNEDLEKGTAYVMVAGENDDEEESEEYTLENASDYVEKVKALFATEYTDVNVLGIFKATKAGEALVSLDKEAFDFAENKKAYLVDVTLADPANKGEMTLLSSDKETKVTTTGDTVAYVKAAEVEADTTYAVVTATSSSASSKPTLYSDSDISKPTEDQTDEARDAFEGNENYDFDEVLGVFTAKENAPALVPAKVEAGTYYVFFVPLTVINPGSVKAAASATPIESTLYDDSEMKNETASGSESSYALSKNSLISGTDYAIVSATKSSKTTIGSSSSGCNAGFAGLAVLAALALIKKSK
ncbi:MAG: SYNERG-CTERM sorting domain-containing protein [Synergistaceae bacterium]|nr:SYNERG-CTERM sorting domain-containing protein [Synergistaceae bacterium]